MFEVELMPWALYGLTWLSVISTFSRKVNWMDNSEQRIGAHFSWLYIIPRFIIV